MLLYESKVVGSYRLCRVTAVTPSDDECVRTVTVGYLPRKQLKQTVYRPVTLETKEVAIQRLVLLIPVKEQQLNEQAAEQKVAYTNHHQELRLDEQPRAQVTTPTRSLPPTRRPAGAGGQCRAGLSNRLANLAIMLCLIPCHSPCANPKLEKDHEKELLMELLKLPQTANPVQLPSFILIERETSPK